MQAKVKWSEFRISDQFLPRFEVVKDGPDRGLVRKFGKSIYSDYDLMAIVHAAPDGRMTDSLNQIEVRSNDGKHLRWILNPKELAFVKKVIREINNEIGIEIIQHGAEFLYEKVGAKAKEKVHWFGPGGQFKISESSMPYSEDKDVQRNIMH